ncbi:hypothetical protein AFLA_006585 [Aspergillus flavus NRRL3357]|nr:hypothetical protein AFLA_006585 [Aspergillus flavus NRRL3357]
MGSQLPKYGQYERSFSWSLFGDLHWILLWAETGRLVQQIILPWRNDLLIISSSDSFPTPCSTVEDIPRLEIVLRLKYHGR